VLTKGICIRVLPRKQLHHDSLLLHHQFSTHPHAFVLLRLLLRERHLFPPPFSDKLSPYCRATPPFSRKPSSPKTPSMLPSPATTNSPPPFHHQKCNSESTSLHPLHAKTPRSNFPVRFASLYDNDAFFTHQEESHQSSMLAKPQSITSTGSATPPQSFTPPQSPPTKSSSLGGISSPRSFHEISLISTKPLQVKTSGPHDLNPKSTSPPVTTNKGTQRNHSPILMPKSKSPQRRGTFDFGLVHGSILFSPEPKSKTKKYTKRKEEFLIPASSSTPSSKKSTKGRTSPFLSEIADSSFLNEPLSLEDSWKSNRKSWRKNSKVFFFLFLLFFFFYSRGVIVRKGPNQCSSTSICYFLFFFAFFDFFAFLSLIVISFNLVSLLRFDLIFLCFLLNRRKNVQSQVPFHLFIFLQDSFSWFLP